jgi:hypothetical protein
MKNFKNFKNQNSGTTLFELLVWIVIIGAILSVIFPGLYYRAFGPSYYPSRYNHYNHPGYRQNPNFWPRW